MPVEPVSRPDCDQCGERLGTNPDCFKCQEWATEDADRVTAKTGGRAANPTEPRAFSSRGGVD